MCYPSTFLSMLRDHSTNSARDSSLLRTAPAFVYAGHSWINSSWGSPPRDVQDGYGWARI